MQTTFAAEITRLFLLWPGRFERDRCVGSLPAPLHQDALRRDCQRHLRNLLVAFHEDDLDSALKNFFTEHTRLFQWYRSLVAGRSIVFDFFDSQPRIGCEHFADWWWLTRYVDPDALVTHQLAERGQAHFVDRLLRWGTFPVSSDLELDRILSQGIADTHIHLTGCEPAPLLWQRIITGLTGVEQVDRYSLSEMDRLVADSESLRGRLAEKAMIRTAMKAREDLRAAMQADTQWWHLTCEASQEERRGAPIVPALVEERRLLAWAWAEAKRDREKTEEQLDRYLFGKNLFLCYQQLHAATNPGLRTFRRYFEGAKEKMRNRSRRVQAHEMERRLRFASESPHLTSLELRVSPFDSVAEYVEFFRAWQEVERKLAKERRLQEGPQKRLKIRFVIHFIRSQSGDELSDAVPFERLRGKIDRQSAVLHLFRQKVPELARYVVGIDVANLERDCPPAVFTPYMRFLRGQVGELKADDCGALCHSVWLRLRERDEADHPVDLPRLGLTYHAGEDFYHPIEGMRNMDEAIHGAEMVPGDRLGHGLAAGWDLEAFYSLRGRGLTLPLGVLLDDLVWLWRRLDEEGPALRKEGHRALEEIAKLSREVYGRAVPADVLYRLQRHWRDRPVPTPSVPNDGPLAGAAWYDEKELWHMEFFDRGCRKKRSLLVPLSEFFLNYSPALATVQEGFLKELAKKRIVVEFNPTSNWALGHFSDLRSHPFHRYVEVQGPGALVTFNTDDPGVLGSRIENEFELMLDSLSARSAASRQTRAALLQMLDNVREVGLLSIFRDT